MKAFVFFISLLLLTGCMATGPTFTEAPPPTGDNAIIYVYRIANFGASGARATFYVNDKQVFALRADGYSYFVVPPGNYVLSQDWYQGYPDINFGTFTKDVKVRVSAKSGETRYFRFEANAAPAGYNEVEFQWDLHEVSASVGKSEIADKHFREQNIVNPTVP
jgi:hypothetical protein